MAAQVLGQSSDPIQRLTGAVTSRRSEGNEASGGFGAVGGRAYLTECLVFGGRGLTHNAYVHTMYVHS